MASASWAARTNLVNENLHLGLSQEGMKAKLFSEIAQDYQNIMKIIVMKHDKYIINALKFFNKLVSKISFSRESR